MIPHDLPRRFLSLPETDNHSIVVITGEALRHDRFALRLQQEFGKQVVAWLKCGSRAAPKTARQSRTAGFARRLIGTLKNPRRVRPSELIARLTRRLRKRSLSSSQRLVEETLFQEEVRYLERFSTTTPRRITDPNSPEVVEYVSSLSPYFIVTLGGDIFRQQLLDQARGIALNQHDGWCPEYKGSATVNWALYHRDLPRLGNTVHVLTSGMDAGPIVRRTTACILPGDSAESCFARSVALGTELMCEVVAEIIASKQLAVSDQSPDSGFTYLLRHLSADVHNTIERDLKAGWLRFELDRLRQF